MLPLLFVAAAAFAISYVLFQEASSLHPTRVPLWLLSSSIGVVATVGATTAVVFGDFSEVGESPTEMAWQSGEYLLVPARVWESRRSPSEPEGTAGAPRRGRTIAGQSLPAHARSPTPPGGPVPAPATADRLAAQVDQLLRELSLEEPEMPIPGRPDPSREDAAQWSEDAARDTGIPIADGLSARAEYESLLRTLSEQAQQGPSALASMRCSGCARFAEVTAGWEPCPNCERPFCPDCVERYRPGGSAFRCPRCRATSRR